jgi:hypothetical protein
VDESRNPNSALWQMMPKMWCFKDAKKFNYLFLYFWLGLLFCRLLCSGFGELVSMMERDPSYSMDNLYELCESWFLGMIGVELSKE